MPLRPHSAPSDRPRSRSPVPRYAASLALAAALLLASPSLGTADETAPASGPAGETGAAEGVPRWELGLGAVGLTMPDYRGSDEVRAYVFPLPWVVYRLDWLKVDRSGVRSIFFESDRAEVNFSMGASPPVRSDNNRAREGMENLRPLVEAGPSLDVRLWRSEGKKSTLKLLMPLRGALTLESRTRYAGVTFSPALNLDVGGIGGGWNVGLVTGPLFANRRQNEYYYSVPEKDALPDRPAYEARSGYGGFQFLASLTRRFGNVWLGAYGRYDTLRGAAFEESPLVRRDWYASGGLGLAYVFAVSEEKVKRGDWTEAQGASRGAPSTGVETAQGGGPPRGE